MDMNWKPDKQGLKIVSIEQFKQEHPELYEKSILQQDGGDIRFCRIIDYQNVLSGTFVVPVKARPVKERWAFAFCLDNNVLYFIGNVSQTTVLIEEFEKHYGKNESSPLMFLVSLMLFMVQDDIYYLDDYYARLEQLEEEIYEQHPEGMERFIMTTRKDMEILSSYYLQMSVAAEALQRTIYEKKIDMAQFNSLLTLFETKVNQLHNFVDTIKGYTGQIWNLRQTQLSDRQNKITTVLTIITTIFLPLTLITGWFGMNFQDLPLIYTKGGYWFIVLMAGTIVSCELFYIWKKHWFK